MKNLVGETVIHLRFFVASSSEGHTVVILNEVKNLVCLLIKQISMEKKGYVYILASRKGGALYVGVTSNIERRILQHKRGVFDGFTKKYCIHRLVRFQELSTITEAIEYEKVIKGWKRMRKIELIEEENKERNDLSEKWRW